MNTDEAFNAYEKFFAKSIAEMPFRKPWVPKDRTEIISIAKKSLGISDKWIPEIKAEIVKTVRRKSFRIDMIKFKSWENTIGTAHLYVPEDTGGKKLPAVILCCGHGGGGKLCPAYQAMALRLAKQGAAVLVSDNMGQGERVPMGHAKCVVPFACGLSVQGLIVMETMGWLEWLKNNPIIDKERIAAIGNSGGGTLTMFLAALSEGISVISSSGYPSSFYFVGSKEKNHCHCNVIPGIIGQVEMWELYGVFAPKKMLIFQGQEDSMFPPDVFYSTARKIKSVYSAVNAEKYFRFEICPGTHSWDSARRLLISSFLADALSIGPAEEVENDLDGIFNEDGLCLAEWPSDAATTDETAIHISGIEIGADIKMADVFPPRYMPDCPTNVTARGDSIQILSKFEAFSKKQ